MSMNNERSDEKKTSYKQIIKSTSVVGGAQVIQILIGIVRTKVVAVLLGTGGIGLLGLYQSILDLVRNLTGFGINFSGVKDIAEAKSTDNKDGIGRSVTILRRWAIATGLLGFFLMFVLSIPFSFYTFGDRSYAPGIAILSFALIFTSISQSQTTLLQGMQKISSMAISIVAGAAASCIISIPVYIFFGVKGIVPSLLLMSLATLCITWFFSRRIKVVKVKLTVKETFDGGFKMAQLGFFMVVNMFVATATMYFIRRYVANKAGIHAVGLFQASWTIANTYLGVVLNCDVS